MVKGLIKGGGHSNREEDTFPRNGHKRNKGKNQTFFSDHTEYLVSSGNDSDSNRDWEIGIRLKKEDNVER